MEEKAPHKISEEEKLKIIDNLASAVQSVFVAPKKLYARSFLSGVFSALGATVGLAVIITIVGILVRHFGGLPVIGHWLTALASLFPTKK